MKLIFALLYAAAILMPSNKHQLKTKVVDTITQEQTVARQKVLQGLAMKKAQKVFTIQAKEIGNDGLSCRAKTEIDRGINKYSLPMILVIE